MSMPDFFDNAESCVDSVLSRVGPHIVLGTPLGLGKPNQFINALYQRVKENKQYSLKIITALSFEIPGGRSLLEKKFLGPFCEKVFGDYVVLDYMRDLREDTLPGNISLYEFYAKSGSIVGLEYAQRHHTSTNYTHVPGNLEMQEINVLAQLVSKRGDDNSCFSMSCNPEITLDVFEKGRDKDSSKKILVGQVHRDLPFMPNDAAVEADYFDMIIENPSYNTRLFAPPDMPVSRSDYLIGLYASSLIKDGGTLQLGISSLSDALVYACQKRHLKNDFYKEVLHRLGASSRFENEIKNTGDLETFEKGLYGNSEMFVDGFLDLIESGILKRKVDSGYFLDAGFFLGPKKFYDGLKNLPKEKLDAINMTRISFVNSLYGNEESKRRQRVGARFINTVFSATLLGAATADALENGQIISGVGGQYNFVAQAHELEGARSILMLKATRSKKGVVSSNIRWSYGHTTIPRHLRDVFVTEYGIADLRGKCDEDCIKAMLNICDSRFQDELMEKAKSEGKLHKDYVIPSTHQDNFPQKNRDILAHYQSCGEFPKFPFGSDFDEQEIVLLQCLKNLKRIAHDEFEVIKRFLQGLTLSDKPYDGYLSRMDLRECSDLGSWFHKNLLKAELKREL